MNEMFDLNQPIGRINYLLRIILANVIGNICFKFIPKIFLANNIPMPTFVIFIIQGLGLTAICLMYFSIVKRSKDLGSSGKFIGGTFMLLIFMQFIGGFMGEQSIITNYIDLLSKPIMGLMIMQLIYLLFSPSKLY